MKIYFVYAMTDKLAFPNYRLVKICATKPVAEQWMEKHKDDPKEQFDPERIDYWNSYFQIKEVDVIENV